MLMKYLGGLQGVAKDGGDFWTCVAIIMMIIIVIIIIIMIMIMMILLLTI